MQIMLDFDGVLTDETIHAKLHRDALIDELVKLTGFEKERVIKDFNAAKEAVLKNPHKYGWIINGTVTGFAEDLFTLTNSSACLMAIKNKSYSDAVKNSHNFDIGTLCLHVFDDATRNAPPSFKQGIKEGIDKLKKMADIVIFSNSEPDKIKKMLKTEKLNIPVIGNAKKYMVDNSFNKVPESKRINNFKIHLRRPFYFEKLNEFKDALVVGDVFSIDLALPLYLKHKIVLMLNSYTPKWSKRYCKRHGHIVRNLFELSELISKI